MRVKIWYESGEIDNFETSQSKEIDSTLTVYKKNGEVKDIDLNDVRQVSHYA